MTITVEAGITLGAIQALLAQQNQRLNLDSPHRDRATLGGIFATNTSGPRRFGAGRPRDQVIGVSFVTADGAVVKGGGRVVKNVAGYDFPRLLTGSLGTLGILTQLTLKVRPIPEGSVLVWSSYSTPGELGAALEGLNVSETRPIAVEVLDPSAARLVGEPIGVANEGWALIVGFEDTEPNLGWQLDRLSHELDTSPREVLQGNDAAPLWNALTEFPAANHGPVTVVANLRPSALVEFVDSLQASHWSAHAHAGNGIVHAHAQGDLDLETVAHEIEEARSRAVRHSGNLILSKCPADWKERLRVWGEPRPDWLLAQRIKTAFDPRGVMNPGRFVGTI
jgi:glycolate oxidase FAD binding subunit